MRVAIFSTSYKIEYGPENTEGGQEKEPPDQVVAWESRNGSLRPTATTGGRNRLPVPGYFGKGDAANYDTGRGAKGVKAAGDNSQSSHR